MSAPAPDLRVDPALPRVAGWLRLPKGKFDASKLRAKLTLTGQASSMSPGEEEVLLRLYRETDDFIYVPRQAGFIPPAFIKSAVDATTLGDPRDFGPAFPMRPYQPPAVEEYLRALASTSPYGGLLEAPAGAGKTVMMLDIIRRLGRTTIVIVHKEFLMNQWKERIQTFLPNARIGIVQQDRCEFGDDYDIVLCMVHSLASRNYPVEFYRWPGVVVSDECHRLGAETWAPVIPLFSARYRMGGTATARRKDSMEPAFFWHIGPIISRVSREHTPVMSGVVKVVNFDKRYNLAKYQRGKFNISKWTTDICAMGERNDLIEGLLVRALREGRRILALTDRLDQITAFENRIAPQLPTIKIGRYIGGKTEDQLTKAAECQLIFGTYSMAAEGLDIPDLDTLFMLTPKSDVEQAVGRVQRFVEGKKNPIVLDFVDSCVGMAVGMSKARQRTYRKLGFRII